MADITIPKAAEGFSYSDEPQGSQAWITTRVGKVTASNLFKWLAVSKRDGKPLAARLAYEREIAYERQFNVPFNRFTTKAMEEGQIAEGFIVQQYNSLFNTVVRPSGAFYNDLFVASPDGLVGDDGLIEVKWLYDNSFSDVLMNGVPDEHFLQIQGQLLASGRKWCDYVAASGNVGKLKVIRVKPDKATQERILNSLEESKDIPLKFSEGEMFDFSKPFTVDEIDWR